MGRFSRWTVIGFILLFTWMLLSGWETESPRGKLGVAVLVAVTLTLAVGLAKPGRFLIALRMVTGTVAIGCLYYAISEIIDLLTHGPQPVAVGQPSAVMSMLAVIVWGIPCAVFAIAGVPTGVWRVLQRDHGKGRMTFWKGGQTQPTPSGEGYNFTDDCRVALVQARFEALAQGSPVLTPSHLVLGVLKTMPGPAFERLLLSPSTYRELCDALDSTPDHAPADARDIIYAESAKHAISGSLVAAGPAHPVWPIHILIGIHAPHAPFDGGPVAASHVADILTRGGLGLERLIAIASTHLDEQG